MGKDCEFLTTLRGFKVWKRLPHEQASDRKNRIENHSQVQKKSRANSVLARPRSILETENLIQPIMPGSGFLAK